MATLESIEAQIDDLRDHIDSKFDALDTLLEGMVVEATCAVCQGTGEVNSPVDGEPGPPYTCPRCSGVGKVVMGELEGP